MMMMMMMMMVMMVVVVVSYYVKCIALFSIVSCLCDDLKWTFTYYYCCCYGDVGVFGILLARLLLVSAILLQIEAPPVII